MPEDTQPPKDEVLLPYSIGGKKTQPPGNSPLKRSCTRTWTREASPSSTPGLRYTVSIFNQTPDGGKPKAARLPVACGLGGEEAGLPGAASAGVQYNNVKPPTHRQHLIPEQEPALQQEAERSCFTLEFFRQFLPPAQDGLPPLHPPPPAPHGRQRRGPELSTPRQRRLSRRCCRSSDYNQQVNSETAWRGEIFPSLSRDFCSAAAKKDVSRMRCGYCLEMDWFLRHLRVLRRIAGPLQRLRKTATGSKRLTVEAGQGELLKPEVVCRCGKGNRERQQSNATLRIRHFIVVSTGQRRCKSKARSTLRKSLPRGGTNIPVQRAAATVPRAQGRQQPL